MLTASKMYGLADRLRTFAANAFSVLTSDVVTRASTFALYAIVARRLGTQAFGTLSLALTLFAAFQVFAIAGLKTLVARAVSKDRSRTSEYLNNASMVVLITSLFSVGALALFVLVMRYARSTSTVVLLLALGLLPYSLCAIGEAIFQAWERMRYIAYAIVPVNIAKIGLAALILVRGHGLYALIVMLLASQVAVLCIEWWLLLKYIARPGLSFAPRFALNMVRSTSTFLGSDVLIALYGNLNLVLVARLLGDRQAGLYNAATQILVPVLLFYQSVVFSIFPALCRKFVADTPSLQHLSNELVELMFTIGAPIAVGLFFFGDKALLALYARREFLQAVPVLRVMVWILIVTALTAVLGEVLIASHYEKVRLRIVAVNAITSLVAGLVLITSLGLIGAAIALLLTRIVDSYQHYRVASRVLSLSPLSKLIWKPLMASVLMGAYLWSTNGRTGTLFAMAGAGAVYGVILLILAVWSAGGPRELKAKKLYGWSE